MGKIQFRFILLLLASISSTCFALDFKLQPIEGGYGGGLAATLNMDGHDVAGYLDSGAVFTCLVSDAFSEAYPEIRPTQYETLSGTVKDASIISIGELRLDDVILHDHQLVRFAKDDVEYNLFGLDLFEGSRIFYDFDALQLRIIPSAPAGLPLMKLQRWTFGEISPDAEIAGQPVRTLWDTGASLTSVDESLVSAQPAAFEFVADAGSADDGSGKPLPIKLYKVDGLTVGGHAFPSDTLVYVMKMSSSRPPLILGYNVITQLDWYFDLKENLWGVTSTKR